MVLNKKIMTFVIMITSIVYYTIKIKNIDHTLCSMYKDDHF